ncbi:flavodoxin family protein [Caproiciproducens sp. MSJ-32]|uniref:flavodoxin family protein n=1 Tax=Caproiciproducens sp. MSJ-32 TaxID=2841527 RepID=UPI001C10FE28|nr:flavodoxin family protein [Caproiciproducens sp. MSJ-32]MBU5454263.1 flavodoxin family protein [Caproiciproducens sp. MSJ-32]
MKYAVVYSSVTGNTKKLAEAIKNKVGECYFGKPSDEALEADIIFIGFWTIGTCGQDIKTFISKLVNKKVFTFGTAGYNNTKEYFDGILNSVKALIPDSNTLIGSYMCQGKVSEAVKDKIKNGMPEKYEAIKDKLLEAENHPNEDDIELLMLELEKLL